MIESNAIKYSSTTKRNFGNYPLLIIVEHLNLNDKLKMINFNRSLRKNIMNYYKCKVFKKYLQAWKKLKSEFIEQEVNEISKFLSEFDYTTYMEHIYSSEFEIEDTFFKNEKIEYEALLLLKILQHLKFNLISPTLNFSSISIPINGVKIISKLINSSFCSHIKILNLNSTKLGAEGIQILVEALAQNLNINELHLESNSISDNGCKILSEELKLNSSLKYISLSYNNIRDEGIKWLADAMKNNSSLTSINLQGNRIGREGCISLGESLKINSSLLYLNLSFNQIVDEGCKFLGDAIKKNLTLKEITLDHNKINWEGWMFLQEALKINSMIQAIRLMTFTAVLRVDIIKKIDPRLKTLNSAVC